MDKTAPPQTLIYTDQLFLDDDDLADVLLQINPSRSQEI